MGHYDKTNSKISKSNTFNMKLENKNKTTMDHTSYSRGTQGQR